MGEKVLYILLIVMVLIQYLDHFNQFVPSLNHFIVEIVHVVKLQGVLPHIGLLHLFSTVDVIEGRYIILFFSSNELC